jgi:hypothetical protein
MKYEKIAEQLARSFAGLAIIQRVLKDDCKPPIEKKMVCKISISKMRDGGEPMLNALVIPVIIGYLLDIMSDKDVLDLIDQVFSCGDGELQKVTDEANDFMDKRDALIKLYKEGGIHVNEEDVK